MAESQYTPLTLAQRFAAPELLIVPGVHDMIAARLARKAGFDVLYGSGFWLTASAHGLPDAGIVGYAEMHERIARLVKVSGATVIADADTGYGGLLNVHHTVLGFEEAGAAAIQIEDQVFPKKCGHTPNRQVVAAEEMADKIRVACEARRNPDTLIIARTDSRESEGLARSIERAHLYAEAGADVLFVEALHGADEMRTACREISAPMMANMSNGGYTPMLGAEELRDMGYRAGLCRTARARRSAADHGRARRLPRVLRHHRISRGLGIRPEVVALEPVYTNRLLEPFSSQ